jgi:toxin CcdB
VVQEMAAIPANNLGAKVTKLEALRSEILAAVDLLLTGI